MTPSVTPATTGPAAGETSAGTSASLRRMSGERVTGISISTVPATVGVKMRLSSAIRVARRNWTSDDAMTSVASMAGPPCSSAATLTARKALVLPITRM